MNAPRKFHIGQRILVINGCAVPELIGQQGTIIAEEAEYRCKDPLGFRGIARGYGVEIPAVPATGVRKGWLIQGVNMIPLDDPDAEQQKLRVEELKEEA